MRTEDIVIPGAAGSNPARVYRPQGEGPFPLILYFHGGGWVIADLDTYDATPRSIAAQSNAIVVSAHYRQAPEHRLPAAHDDAFAAWRWLVDNAASLGGEPDRIAVMGESAGGNLAINVSIRARETGTRMPLHQALIYPVASNNIVSVSYEENRNARPLSKPMMLWFVHNVINSESDLTSPLIDVVSADLSGLPPTRDRHGRHRSAALGRREARAEIAERGRGGRAPQLSRRDPRVLRDGSGGAGGARCAGVCFAGAAASVWGSAARGGMSGLERWVCGILQQRFYITSCRSLTDQMQHDVTMLRMTAMFEQI